MAIGAAVFFQKSRVFTDQIDLGFQGALIERFSHIIAMMAILIKTRVRFLCGKIKNKKGSKEGNR
jgi:hypothetical protein